MKTTEGRRKVPSLIKIKGSLPMPKNVVENPCPPEDPQYHDAWVASIKESDRNNGFKRPPGFYTNAVNFGGG
jgi:hypothetical protein